MHYIIIQSLKCHVIRLSSLQYALTILLRTTLYSQNKFLKLHGGDELCDRSKMKGAGSNKIIPLLNKCIFCWTDIDFFCLTDAISS
jgi:hypothetical protein